MRPNLFAWGNSGRSLSANGRNASALALSAVSLRKSRRLIIRLSSVWSGSSFESRQLDEEISFLDSRGELIEWAGRRTADHVANDVEVPIMAGTNIVLLIRMPGDTTTEVCANI